MHMSRIIKEYPPTSVDEGVMKRFKIMDGGKTAQIIRAFATHKELLLGVPNDLIGLFEIAQKTSGRVLERNLDKENPRIHRILEEWSDFGIGVMLN